MSSNNAPAPYVAIGNANNGTGLGNEYLAFDGTNDTWSQQSVSSPLDITWLGIILERKYKLTSYSMSQSQQGYIFVNYQVQGSNDGNIWFTIDDVTNNSSFNINKNVTTGATYSRFRVRTTTTNNLIRYFFSLQFYGIPA